MSFVRGRHGPSRCPAPIRCKLARGGVGFLPEPSREVVEALVAHFSAAADAVVAVVDVGRVIRNAPDGE
jgi:hypothetical protein